MESVIFMNTAYVRTYPVSNCCPASPQQTAAQLVYLGPRE
jgi:hypothetical protein